MPHMHREYGKWAHRHATASQTHSDTHSRSNGAWMGACVRARHSQSRHAHSLSIHGAHATKAALRFSAINRHQRMGASPWTHGSKHSFASVTASSPLTTPQPALPKPRSLSPCLRSIRGPGSKVTNVIAPSADHKLVPKHLTFESAERGKTPPCSRPSPCCLWY